MNTLVLRTGVLKNDYFCLQNGVGTNTKVREVSENRHIPYTKLTKSVKKPTPLSKN